MRKRAVWSVCGLVAAGTALMVESAGAGVAQEPPEAGQVVSLEARDIDVKLTVAYADNVIGTDKVRLRNYNGKLVGPTLRVRPGDTLNVALINDLPEPSTPIPAVCVAPPDHAAMVACINVPRDFNTTNLHTHGLHVSPSGVSDNVLIAVPPQRRLEYEINVPRNHPPGTHWYHAHVHGATSVQVGSGMAGALIVEGDVDRVPAIQAARERILVLQHIQYVMGDDGVGKIEKFAYSGTSWQNSPAPTTINGVERPTYEMQPGAVERWRLINASFGERVRLQIRAPGGSTPAVQPYLFAVDGITTGKLEQLDEVDLYPGYRADVLVKAPDEEGDYVLYDAAAKSPTTCDPPPPQGQTCPIPEVHTIIGTLVVKGAKVAMALPAAEELAPLAPYATIADDELVPEARQTVTFDLTNGVYRVGTNKDDPQPFDPTAEPRQLRLGDVAEWTVSDVGTGGGGHPFHIHVNPFQEFDDNGKPGYWRDTILVPKGGKVTLRTRYLDYTGIFVLHCHILDHEDQGMMELVEIVGTPSHAPHAHLR